jgi:hypothetical protein
MTKQTISKKKKTNSIQDEKGNLIWSTLKTILQTTWGMRIGLAILGVLLFFMGYIIGNWGTSSLESEIANKRSDINDLIKDKESLVAKVTKHEADIMTLRISLSDSKSKNRFLQQRNKILSPLYQALKLWKKKDSQGTQEKIYAALINLKREASGSMGLSSWFYRITEKRFENIISLIKKGCSQPQTPETPDATADRKKVEETCYKNILQLIASTTNILPAPQ